MKKDLRNISEKNAKKVKAVKQDKRILALICLSVLLLTALLASTFAGCAYPTVSSIPLAPGMEEEYAPGELSNKLKVLPVDSEVLSSEDEDADTVAEDEITEAPAPDNEKNGEEAELFASKITSGSDTSPKEQPAESMLPMLSFHPLLGGSNVAGKITVARSYVGSQNLPDEMGEAKVCGDTGETYVSIATTNKTSSSEDYNDIPKLDHLYVDSIPEGLRITGYKVRIGEDDYSKTIDIAEKTNIAFTDEIKNAEVADGDDITVTLIYDDVVSQITIKRNLDSYTGGNTNTGDVLINGTKYLNNKTNSSTNSVTPSSTDPFSISEIKIGSSFISNGYCKVSITVNGKAYSGKLSSSVISKANGIVTLDPAISFDSAKDVVITLKYFDFGKLTVERDLTGYTGSSGNFGSINVNGTQIVNYPYKSGAVNNTQSPESPATLSEIVVGTVMNNDLYISKVEITVNGQKYDGTYTPSAVGAANTTITLSKPIKYDCTTNVNIKLFYSNIGKLTVERDLTGYTGSSGNFGSININGKEIVRYSNNSGSVNNTQTPESPATLSEIVVGTVMNNDLYISKVEITVNGQKYDGTYTPSAVGAANTTITLSEPIKYDCKSNVNIKLYYSDIGKITVERDFTDYTGSSTTFGSISINGKEIAAYSKKSGAVNNTQNPASPATFSEIVVGGVLGKDIFIKKVEITVNGQPYEGTYTPSSVGAVDTTLTLSGSIKYDCTTNVNIKLYYSDIGKISVERDLSGYSGTSKLYGTININGTNIAHYNELTGAINNTQTPTDPASFSEIFVDQVMSDDICISKVEITVNGQKYDGTYTPSAVGDDRTTIALSKPIKYDCTTNVNIKLYYKNIGKITVERDISGYSGTSKLYGTININGTNIAHYNELTGAINNTQTPTDPASFSEIFVDQVMSDDICISKVEITVNGQKYDGTYTPSAVGDDRTTIALSKPIKYDCTTDVNIKLYYRNIGRITVERDLSDYPGSSGLYGTVNINGKNVVNYPDMSGFVYNNMTPDAPATLSKIFVDKVLSNDLYVSKIEITVNGEAYTGTYSPTRFAAAGTTITLSKPITYDCTTDVNIKLYYSTAKITVERDLSDYPGTSALYGTVNINGKNVVSYPDMSGYIYNKNTPENPATLSEIFIDKVMSPDLYISKIEIKVNGEAYTGTYTPSRVAKAETTVTLSDPITYDCTTEIYIKLYYSTAKITVERDLSDYPGTSALYGTVNINGKNVVSYTKLSGFIYNQNTPENPETLSKIYIDKVMAPDLYISKIEITVNGEAYTGTYTPTRVAKAETTVTLSDPITYDCTTEIYIKLYYSTAKITVERDLSDYPGTSALYGTVNINGKNVVSYPKLSGFIYNQNTPENPETLSNIYIDKVMAPDLYISKVEITVNGEAYTGTYTPTRVAKAETTVTLSDPITYDCTTEIYIKLYYSTAKITVERDLSDYPGTSALYGTVNINGKNVVSYPKLSGFIYNQNTPENPETLSKIYIDKVMAPDLYISKVEITVNGEAYTGTYTPTRVAKAETTVTLSDPITYDCTTEINIKLYYSTARITVDRDFTDYSGTSGFYGSVSVNGKQIVSYSNTSGYIYNKNTPEEPATLDKIVIGGVLSPDLYISRIGIEVDGEPYQGTFAPDHVVSTDTTVTLSSPITYDCHTNINIVLYYSDNKGLSITKDFDGCTNKPADDATGVVTAYCGSTKFCTCAANELEHMQEIRGSKDLSKLSVTIPAGFYVKNISFKVNDNSGTHDYSSKLASTVVMQSGDVLIDPAVTIDNSMKVDIVLTYAELYKFTVKHSVVSDRLAPGSFTTTVSAPADRVAGANAGNGKLQTNASTLSYTGSIVPGTQLSSLELVPPADYFIDKDKVTVTVNGTAVNDAIVWPSAEKLLIGTQTLSFAPDFVMPMNDVVLEVVYDDFGSVQLEQGYASTVISAPSTYGVVKLTADRKLTSTTGDSISIESTQKSGTAVSIDPNAKIKTLDVTAPDGYSITAVKVYADGKLVDDAVDTSVLPVNGSKTFTFTNFPSELNKTIKVVVEYGYTSTLEIVQKNNNNASVLGSVTVTANAQAFTDAATGGPAASVTSTTASATWLRDPAVSFKSLTVTPPANTSVISVKGEIGESGSMTEWKDSADMPVVYLDDDGNVCMSAVDAPKQDVRITVEYGYQLFAKANIADKSSVKFGSESKILTADFVKLGNISGNSVSFSVELNEGYKLESVKYGNTPAEQTSVPTGSYSISKVNGNIYVDVMLSKLEPTITIDTTGNGFVTTNGDDDTDVSGRTYKVEYDSDHSFDFIPEVDYKLLKVTVKRGDEEPVTVYNGAPAGGLGLGKGTPDYSYILKNVKEDVRINAYFSAPQYTVHVTIKGKGTVTYGGNGHDKDFDLKVTRGDEPQFKLAAAKGYKLSTVTAGPAADSQNKLTIKSNVAKLDPVTGDVYVIVTFETSSKNDLPSDTPETGDFDNLVLLFNIMLLCGMTAFICMKNRKGKNSER